MINTEGDQITDFTTLNREEIRDELTAAIGDNELPETVREALVLKLEDRDNVTPDEFWAVVQEVFTAHEA
ncbi:hypothetical protein [Glycomyces tenuis]|uniref:hypothetical protein n=1 Tax=Glycomyces tenuis TaxID=58116 RepID=UPI00040A2F0D|nr:hypothetical protein [Glycomyces tenuis]